MRICLAICLTVPLFFMCKLVEEETGGTTITSQDFRISGQITGWTETATDGYRTYDTQTLFDIINGGATEFVQNGLVEGIVQKMKTADGKTCESFVMDFSTADKAAAMFDIKSTQYTTKVDVGTFARTTAFGYQHLAGIKAYAHFGQFYIETSFGGYGGQLTQAQEIADQFLNLYSSLVN